MVEKYRGSPTSIVSTSTNSTCTHFQEALPKFNLYDFASMSPTCTNSTCTISNQSPTCTASTSTTSSSLQCMKWNPLWRNILIFMHLYFHEKYLWKVLTIHNFFLSIASWHDDCQENRLGLNQCLQRAKSYKWETLM